jgi:predicted transcriptional regulator/DNA-binding XRE family transcriptional regulator
MRKQTRLGARMRSLRRQAGLTQAELAERLNVSASYVNLLENERRPLTAELLLGLGRALDVDLRTLTSGPDAELLAGLMEAFGDPVFDDHRVSGGEVTSFVESHPDVARAVLALHGAYALTRVTNEALRARVLNETESAPSLAGADRVRLSTEQVSDFIQRQGNHFPELEREAERIWALGRLEPGDLYRGLVMYLRERHGIGVSVLPVRRMGGAVRRLDAQRGELQLSEVLPRGSRSFQVAAQLCLLEFGPLLDQLTAHEELRTEESRALGRAALANYFAGALLMPYAAFLASAEQERYDIELLGHRFDVGWEQACHRLTTLRRPGAEGVPFYMVRVDVAGNISKRFSASGIHFPRFSGLCGLWNVHRAFLQPGRVRTQLCRLAEGGTVMAIAQTVQRHAGGYHTPDVVYAVGVGCDVAYADRIVYCDGIDTHNRDAAVPIGITCRLCDRTDCRARAFPSMNQPLRIDPHVRGISFFTQDAGPEAARRSTEPPLPA